MNDEFERDYFRLWRIVHNLVDAVASLAALVPAALFWRYGTYSKWADWIVYAGSAGVWAGALYIAVRRINPWFEG